MGERVVPSEHPEKATRSEAAERLIQHPETGDFLRGAMVEAAYQRETWPQQDRLKSNADWFWTLGYITGKAVKETDDEHVLHHIEAAAALLANWHRAVKARIELTPPCPVCGTPTTEGVLNPEARYCSKCSTLTFPDGTVERVAITGYKETRR